MPIIDQKLRSDTLQIQEKLANYCRNGQLVAIQGAYHDRLPVYRRLVFNVIADTLESSYPIAYKFLKGQLWDELVEGFFENHQCQSPQLWRMPREFWEYVQNNSLKIKDLYPFLVDLLAFEWHEIEVHTMADLDFPKIKTAGDWFADILVMNPEYELLPLSYPVHLLAPEQITEAHFGQYFVLIFREKEEGKVHFVNLNVFLAFIILQISEKQPLNFILEATREAFGLAHIADLENQAQVALTDLQSQGFILGFLDEN